VALTWNKRSRQLDRARSFLMRFWLFRCTGSTDCGVSYTLPDSRTWPSAARRFYAPRWWARRQDSRRLALRVKLLCGRFPQQQTFELSINKDSIVWLNIILCTGKVLYRGLSSELDWWEDVEDNY
jgi:hypothetical protein